MEIQSDQAMKMCGWVADISSTNDKVSLMKSAPGLIPYLEAAYNPYKKYFIRKMPWYSQRDEQFSEITWTILERLHTRAVTGDNAAHLVKTHIEDLTPLSATLFKNIILKDLRIGMGPKLINKAFPNCVPEHLVMLARLFDKSKVSYPCFTSPKIDGVRAIFRDRKFYTRNGKELHGLHHLIMEAEARKFNMTLDGELTIPGLSFQKSSGQLRSFNDCPTAQYNVFDIPSEKNRPFFERETIMADINSVHISPIIHTLVKDEHSLFYWHKIYLDNGYEGSMVKSARHKYVGSRSLSWMKIKNTLSEDIEVVDFFEGTGKYEGQLGGIIVLRKNGVKVRVGSGFTDDQRRTIWTFREEYIGNIAEVLYHEETPDGSLRHPRFLCWREDK